MNAAVQSQVVTLSWRYLPTILASSLIMLGWALIINNVGRRRYPLHWWAAGRVFVRDPEENDSNGRDLEDGEADRVSREELEEGELKRESLDEEELKEAAGPEPAPGQPGDPGPAYLRDAAHADEKRT